MEGGDSVGGRGGGGGGEEDSRGPSGFGIGGGGPPEVGSGGVLVEEGLDTVPGVLVGGGSGAGGDS